MSWIKRLVSSLRTRKTDDDLEKEIEFHLEMRSHEKASTGMTPEESRREALQRFGSVLRTKEACRDHSTLTWIAAAGQDLRYAARHLQNKPAYTAAVVACMAVGVGASAAIFSFVNAFLFQPLPKDFVVVQRVSGNSISYPEFQDWQRFNGVFVDVVGYTPGERLTMGRGVDSGHVLGETVAGNYFAAQGVLPAAGRLLASGDEVHALAVIGYHYWRREFSGDPGVVGKTIWINHQPFTIEGIAPSTFHGMLSPWSTDVWITSYLHRDALGNRQAGWMMAAALLKKGITPQQAEGAMNNLDGELARKYSVRSAGPRDRLLVAHRGGLSGSPVWFMFTIMAVLLMTVTGIIFLIACANVAGLVIARDLARRREILIRLSLGASRSRLVRQLLTENLLLGLLGAVTGLLAAFSAGDGLAGLMPHSISGGFRFEHGIDLHVLAFTLAMSVAGALLSGLLPALQASGQNLATAGKTPTALGGRTPRLRQVLMAAQVAGSVLVLSTAGLFVRSFHNAEKSNLGFDVGHVLTVDVDLSHMKQARIRNQAFYDRLLRHMENTPGVVSASYADVLPLGNTRVVEIPGAGQIATASVDAQYFHSMGIPLIRGREPRRDEHDVVVVNEAFVQRFWPNADDPVGKPVVLERGKPPRQIIGVTTTGKYWSLDEPPRPFIYQISNRFTEPQLSLIISTHQPAKYFATRIGEELRGMKEDLPEISVRTSEERLRAWLEPQFAASVLLSILGLAALGLASTGLYAQLAQMVTQRAPEIAVRVALGASSLRVLGMLLRQTALLIFAGTVAGIAASVVIARLLSSLAGQAIPLDGITLLCVAALLAIVGAAATMVPAYRALRIDPVDALRTE